MIDLACYPDNPAQRNQWVLDRRSARNVVDPSRPYAFLVEEERAHTGEIVPVATIFLSNRECPWRCVMCDLWKNTLPGPTPIGAIPKQIEYALARLPSARHIKLYNSGSFFDRLAIPPADYPRITDLINRHERVIVESHPALLNSLVDDLQTLVDGQLEVAVGLETVHPQALEKINKGVTLDLFRSAAARLRQASIDLRVFILVQPPFVLPQEALFWAKRSLDFAFECGATAVTLIPTRGGNGAMETLRQNGDFRPPRIQTLEDALAYGLSLQHGRVFVDLWDLRQENQNFERCLTCWDSRIERLQHLNFSQHLSAPVECMHCGGNS